MPRSQLRRAVFSALTVVVTVMPAQATDVCAVQKSADGYVALRDAPSADARLIAKAKSGEAVVIQKSASGDQISSGRWLRVMHYPDTVVPQQTDPNYKKGRLGWMHRRYVDECG